MEGVPEKAISWPVTVYNKKLSNQCNLLAQIEQSAGYKINYSKNYCISTFKS